MPEKIQVQNSRHGTEHDFNAVKLYIGKGCRCGTATQKVIIFCSGKYRETGEGEGGRSN